MSPRNRGLKRGLFVFLMTFLVVPIVAIFTIAIRVEPFAVAIAAISLFVGGLLRMAYAMLFEEHYATAPAKADDFPAATQIHMNRGAALPPPRSIPIDAFQSPQAGNWRDTNALQPSSVVEGTTKLLEKEENF